MTRLPFATGFPGVDDAFGGICPGEIAVFAGGPETGKTAALVHVGAHLNVPVMAFADREAAPRFRERTSRLLQLGVSEPPVVRPSGATPC